MQEIHAIGGGVGAGGRLFTATAGGGGGNGGDRRLRPHGNQNHQPLKCPRCDSLNTKFCYYNNYNLSQPRHFCKNCRRYWTKGGVLRNVPVGGGCRKSKRSKPKPLAASPSSAAPASADEASASAPGEQKSNSHSSSESSSLTATAKSTAEVVSATETNLLSFGESSSSGFFIPQNGTNPNYDHHHHHHHHVMINQHASDGQIFSDIGSFTDMIASSNDAGMLEFNEVDLSAYGHESSKMVGGPTTTTTNTTNPNGEELKMHQEMNTAGYVDQTVQIELSRLEQQSRGSNDGLSPLDWENTRDINHHHHHHHHHNRNHNSGSGEQAGMFDFTGAVDHAYWSQTQWPDDNDQSLNFLP